MSLIANGYPVISCLLPFTTNSYGEAGMIIIIQLVTIVTDKDFSSYAPQRMIFIYVGGWCRIRTDRPYNPYDTAWQFIALYIPLWLAFIYTYYVIFKMYFLYQDTSRADLLDAPLLSGQDGIGGSSAHTPTMKGFNLSQDDEVMLNSVRRLRW